MKFNGMKNGRYRPSSASFPTSVYPQIKGLPVQFVMRRGDDYGVLLSPRGEVNNVSHINDLLAGVFEAIIGEDTAPHFEAVDWKSGVVIEGLLTSDEPARMDDLYGDLVGDFGDVEGIHFIGLAAIPYKFWRAGTDRYDLGMRRATLMRAMAKLGLLAHGNKSCCWLLPRYDVKNEYELMTVCDRLIGSSQFTLQSELSLKAFPKFPVNNGMIYDFAQPWVANSEQLRVPTLDQIEEGLL